MKLNRTTFLAGFLGFLFVFNAFTFSAKADDFCQKKFPKVNIKIDYGKVNYDFNDDAAGIRQVALKEVAKNSITRGLTVATYNKKISVSNEVQVLGDKVCVFAKDIDIYIGFPKMVVYVDSKYKENSCEYNSIISHENEHVGFYQTGLKDYGRKIGQKIYDIVNTADALNETKDFPDDSTDDYVKKYVDGLNKTISNDPDIQDLEAQMNSSVQQKNDYIDRPENYKKVSDQCQNW